MSSKEGMRALGFESIEAEMVVVEVMGFEGNVQYTAHIIVQEQKWNQDACIVQ
ncbi:MAG: hypothetical protein P4L35_17125 [Ignavibacteriaceae bacterium]|nr:hypothetical protein [Ignavibacteriaceae bacterium]